MLRLLGNPKNLCGGLTRRDWLRIGGLGLAGASLPDLLRWQAQASEQPTASRSFGRAKGVILLHLYGSPSQLEWLDPKPEAPVEIRGELNSIESRLPGCRVGELFPKLAQVLDRTTVIRSMTHPYPLHGVAFALTGVPTIDVPLELNPRDARHWPYFGSVVDYVDERTRPSSGPREMPRNLFLPFPFSSQRTGEVPRSGPYAAFFGAEYDPVCTSWVGQATGRVNRTLRDETYAGLDPYVGCSQDSHFVVPAATSLQPDVTIDRLQHRRSLLAQLENVRRDLDQTSPGRSLDRYQAMAYDLLRSDKLRVALDVRRESAAMRSNYGHTLFGQSCLAARRLIENGARVVSVFWDEYALAGSAWDTHWNHYVRMREELCPPLDQALFGLLTDLEERGMLEDTLVVCTSEHGRTPRINNQQGGGRDHWSRCYSTLVAGGGMARGKVLGISDRQAGEVLSHPVSPKDLLATMYHLLGIDPHTQVYDALRRPLPLVHGEVDEALLA